MGCRLLPLALILAPGLALAHPSRAIVPDGTAPHFGFVAGAPDARGNVLARQVVPASPSQSKQVQKVSSKTIYLNAHGVRLRPGANNASAQTSSIVTQDTELAGWHTDQTSWTELVGCVQQMYSRFDVTVTDQAPAAGVDHIEALIGGSPLDVGLPLNVAGVSPFTEDCAVIENSIVFTFTDVLDGNPQLICEIVSQEIAHSFGLDHELLAEDPMTYLDFAGPRSFQDGMAHCGEYDQRECGINGNVCRAMQSSVQILTARLGLAGEAGSDPAQASAPTGGGCDAGGARAEFPLTIALALLLTRARRRRA